MAAPPPRSRQPAGRPTAKKPKKESIFNRKITFGGGGMPAMKEADVLLFTGELADLLEAGMTLGEALGCLANQGEEDSAQRAVTASRFPTRWPTIPRRSSRSTRT